MVGNNFALFTNFLIDAFRTVMEKSTVHEIIPFNFDSEFIVMRFGKDRKRQIPYSEFTQLLRVRSLFYSLFLSYFSCSTRASALFQTV